MRRVRHVVVIAAVGLAVGVPSAAGFQGPWVLPPADLSAADQTTFAPQVAVAQDGTTTVVWSRRSNGSGVVVQTRTRSPGGSFGPAADLSNAGEIALESQVAVAPDGTTTVVWSRYDADGTAGEVVQASTRPPGGAFGEPVNLSASDQRTFDPQLAVAPNGAATAVWTRAGFDADEIVRASTRPPGGAFGEPVNLSADGARAGSARVAVAPDGTTTAVWSRYDGADSIVQASTRPPGGAFGEPVNLSAAGGSALTRGVAVAPDGTTTVVWTRGFIGSGVLQASTRPPGGAFADPVDLDADADSPPQLAVAPDGTTTVIWSHSIDDTHYVIRASTRPPGGTFADPVDISAVGLSTSSFWPRLAVAVAPDGTTTAVWERFDGASTTVQASTRPPGGTFGSPVDLSDAGQPAAEPQVAMAPDGAATAVWIRDSNLVQAAFTINGPPLLRSAPQISGSASLGAQLGCDGGSWAGATSVTTGWLRGAAQIGTGPSHTTTSADQGFALSCRARASNGFGSVEALSPPLSIPALSIRPASTPPIARSLPKIAGKPRLGRTLRCKAAAFTAATRRTTSWLRGAKPIKGARKSTYKITKADLGKIITCRTTATGPGGTSTIISLGIRARR